MQCDVGVRDCNLVDDDGMCADWEGPVDLEGLTSFPIFAFLFMCFMAFSIGANDGANAWGTSVGSQAVSLRTAVLVGGVFEWLGASLLGYGVTETLQMGVSGLRNKDCIACGYCNSQMNEYAVGMAGALTAATVFLLLATYTAIPVSTTHAIAGGVVGAVWVIAGVDCIDFGMNALGGIILSWVLSPLLAGVMAVLLYLLTDCFIVGGGNPVVCALDAFGGIFFGSVFMTTALVLLTSKVTADVLSTPVALVTSIGIAAVATLIGTRLITVPLLQDAAHRTHESLHWGGFMQLMGGELMEGDKQHDGCGHIQMKTNEHDASDDAIECVREKGESSQDEIKDVETVFKYLLVFTATLESFAHGSNDTANATAAFSLIYNVYSQGRQSCSDNASSVWVLVTAGFFVALGVVLCGHHVIDTMGRKLVAITFRRGWCIEFASTATVLLASVCKLPISSTHCQVGAVVAVGLVADGPNDVNWLLVGRIMATWIVCLPVAGLISALVTHMMLR